MKYFLVKENSNWADEFDLEGFKVFKSKSLDSLKSTLLSQFVAERGKTEEDPFPTECSFGTNEYIEIESEEEFFESLTIIEINEDEYKCLKKLFPHCNDWAFGTTAIL